MKAKTTLWMVLLASAMLAPFAACAWGPQGHQAVGAIADELIKGSAAEIQVKAILGSVSLQQASVWADCAKGVTTSDDVNFTYHSNNTAFPECAVYDTPQWKPVFERFVADNWKQCGTAHDGEKCHHQYHYADISNRRNHYAAGEVGANTHDVVHSINAAIEVLQDKPAPAPFVIHDKREALLLLTHYLGDIHQPLHVEAVYLSAKGKVVDPDAIGYHAANDTSGGNAIVDGSEKLHHEWDAIPSELEVGGSGFDNLVARARTVAITKGAMATWSTTWATDTIDAGHVAFTGLHFTAKPPHAGKPQWAVTGTHAAAYKSHAQALKEQQLSDAGARLADVLKAVWPDGP